MEWRIVKPHYIWFNFNKIGDKIEGKLVSINPRISSEFGYIILIENDNGINHISIDEELNTYNFHELLYQNIRITRINPDSKKIAYRVEVYKD